MVLRKSSLKKKVNKRKNTKKSKKSIKKNTKKSIKKNTKKHKGGSTREELINSIILFKKDEENFNEVQYRQSLSEKTVEELNTILNELIPQPPKLVRQNAIVKKSINGGEGEGIWEKYNTKKYCKKKIGFIFRNGQCIRDIRARI